MGAMSSCPCCGHGLCMNAYSKAVENGYCGCCGVDDLRKAVKARKAENAAQREINKRLQAEVDKLKPKPCTRCQCAACAQREAVANIYNSPYNCGGRQS